MNTLQRIIFASVGALLITSICTLPVQAQSPEEIPLGSEMPATQAQLSRAGGGQATLASLQGSQGTVVVFWSNQCPWVEKYADRLAALVNDFSGRGVGFVLINSNDPSAYPQESAQQSAQRASGYPSALAYLSDSDSDVASAFGAQRTPHVFVFDANDMLVYVGTIDDSPGDAGNVTEPYLRRALDALVAGNSIPVPRTKAFGCTIKYSN